MLGQVVLLIGKKKENIFFRGAEYTFLERALQVIVSSHLKKKKIITLIQL